MTTPPTRSTSTASTITTPTLTPATAPADSSELTGGVPGDTEGANSNTALQYTCKLRVTVHSVARGFEYHYSFWKEHSTGQTHIFYQPKRILYNYYELTFKGVFNSKHGSITEASHHCIGDCQWTVCVHYMYTTRKLPLAMHAHPLPTCTLQQQWALPYQSSLKSTHRY